jgi:hypothetical protein
MCRKQVGEVSSVLSIQVLVDRSGSNPPLLVIISIASHLVGALRLVHLNFISSGCQRLELAAAPESLDQATLLRVLRSARCHAVLTPGTTARELMTTMRSQ